MARPVYLFNSSTGSDTLASGAGPATAVTGSNGQTRNAASQLHVGFFDESPDLSGVATDGSHALYIAISTAGQRNFSSIAGVKNTSQTPTGDVSNGSAIIGNMTSTTGFTAGDVVRVQRGGAGSNDLYSTVLTVDSSTGITINDTVTGSESGVIITNPRQVTLTAGEGLNTGSGVAAWAIGGTRLTLANANSAKLRQNNGSSGDLMPGDALEMQSGYTETISATLNFNRAGDTTTGLIEFRGAVGAATRPVITCSANITSITSVNASRKYSGFDLVNTSGTKTSTVGISIGNGTFCTVENVKIADATNTIRTAISATSAASKLTIRDCDLAFGGNIAFNALAPGTVIQNCYIHDYTGNGLTLGDVSGGEVVGCNIVRNGGDGINWNTTTASATESWNFEENTLHGNTGSGLEITAATTQMAGAVIRNNIFSYNGDYGLKCSAAGHTAAYVDASLSFFEGNCFFQNTTGKYLPTGLTCSKNEITTSPADVAIDATKDFAGTVGGHVFNPGANIRAKGYPVGGTTYIGGAAGATYSYRDIGAAQHADPAALIVYQKRGSTVMKM